MLILFSLALVFSPFSSLGESVYAEEEGDVVEVEDESTRDSSEGEKEKQESDEETSKEEAEENESNDEEAVKEEGTDDEDENKDAEDSSKKNEVEEEEGHVEEDFTDQPSDEQDTSGPEDDFIWDVNSDGTAVINGYKDEETSITIPSEVSDGEETFTVTEIGARAFLEGSLTEVIIPDTVNVIGDGAFAFNNNLENVEIPNSVKIIGDGAFAYNSLERIIIPGSVDEIGEEAFINNNLIEVVINEGVKIIGDGAFAYNSLERIIIPGSVDEIGEEAFINNNLIEVVINEGVKVIGDGAFAHNYLEEVIIPSSVGVIGKEKFILAGINKVVMNAGIDRYIPGAFESNNLIKVIIKNKNIQIYGEAFKDNQDLTIWGYADSGAQAYADDRYPFITTVDIGDSTDVFGGDTVAVWDDDYKVHALLEIPYSITNIASTLTLEVKNSDNSPEGHKKAGAVLDFTFKLGNQAIDFDEYAGDDFILSLLIEADDADVAIHHEISEANWKNIGGNIDDGMITAPVNHFSTYGVFVKADEEPEKPKEPKDPKDPEFDPCDSQDPAFFGCPEDEIDDKTTVTIDSDDTDKTDKTVGTGTLPKTATNTFNMLLVGIVLLVIGGITAVYFNRRSRTTFEK